MDLHPNENNKTCISVTDCFELNCLEENINDDNLSEFSCIERVCYCTEDPPFLTWFDVLNFCVFPALTMAVIIIFDNIYSKYCNIINT